MRGSHSHNHNQQAEHPDNYPDKENIPLRMNYEPSKKDKKFSYGFETERRCTTSGHKKNETSSSLSSKDEQIKMLRRELAEEKQKSKKFQARVYQEQSMVLQHLQMLEKSFQKLTAEKNYLELQMRKAKSRLEQEREQEGEEWREKYQELYSDHKKIKKVADSMIQMMRKVDGVEGSTHEAWKWVKKIVWEYEGIRKKALQWKTVYDQVSQAVGLLPN